MADPAVWVRNATDADMASIQAIYGHHVQHGLASFEEVPPSLDEMIARRDAVVSLDLPYLVAVLDERRLPPGGSAAEGRRGVLDERGLPPGGSAAEGRRGLIDGRVLGYAYATRYRVRPAYRYTIEDSVYVADDGVGRGIGSALLGGLIARCETGPWRQMIAVIGDSGNAASIRLHRRHGFREVGTFASAGWKLGRWVDSVLMQRALGAGDTALPG
jgi:L-amino acid N-acyltransferase YncA